MKKGFYALMCLMITAVLSFWGQPVRAGERVPLPGVGWNYPYRDSYRTWKPPKEGYDERMMNQDVIASYGYGAKSVDEIKDLLPESLYTMMKNPSVWGKIRVNVTERKMPKGVLFKRYKEATAKYRGQAKIDAKQWIRNYKAGCPFPEPKTGIEVEWNYRRRFKPDDRIFPVITVITNKRGQVRYQTSDGNLLFMTGRLAADPKPTFLPNPNKIERIDVYANAHPYELQGTISVITQFNDPGKTDELWMYLPSMRRVRHLSTTQRIDKLPGGQDLFWDCFDTFNGNPSLFNFKLLGRKEMLVVMNGYPKGEFILHEYMMGPNDYYQKVNCYVNEIHSKDPNYPFSKIIQYLDPDTWVSYYTDWYDRKGKLQRSSIFNYTLTKNGIVMANVMNHIDFQRVHSTGYAYTNARSGSGGNTYNVGLTPDYFILDHLRKVYPAR